MKTFKWFCSLALTVSTTVAEIGGRQVLADVRAEWEGSAPGSPFKAIHIDLEKTGDTVTHQPSHLSQGQRASIRHRKS